MLASVTGGSGFIGRLLIDRLVERGDQVRVLTRSAEMFPNIDQSGVQVFEGDLIEDSADTFNEFLAGTDIVYHCAGEVADDTRMEALHVDGTKKLLSALPKTTKRWVQLSSVGAYGPVRQGIVGEAAPLNPVECYEVTKTESDRLVIEHAEVFNVILSVLRPSIVIGKTMPNRSVYQLINMIYRRLFFYVGSSNSVMNYIPVDCVVDAMLKCGRREGETVEIYNLSDACSIAEVDASICAGLEVTSTTKVLPIWIAKMLSLGAMFSVKWPVTSGRIEALTNQASYSSEKLVDQLGYVPVQSSQECIREMAEYWKSNR